MDGALVIDKPEGWTSHDVVGKLRRVANTKKIGHLGTLDPFATGVLPLVVGRATRFAQFYTRSDKIYEGTVRFGWATNTYDLTGAPIGEPREAHIDAAALEGLLDRFRGEFLQTPPPVSAKKVAGRRAYELARKNVAVDLAPSPVHVYELKVLAIDGPEVKLRIYCSGGTYMRSIAHDLGAAMGCGAHLAELRRLSSGEFEIAQSRTIAELEALAVEDRLTEALVPMARLLPDFPNIIVDDLTAGQICNGRNFNVSPFRPEPRAKFVKAVTAQGEVVAIGEAVLPNVYHPFVVVR